MQDEIEIKKDNLLLILGMLKQEYIDLERYIKEDDPERLKSCRNIKDICIQLEEVFREELKNDN